jgi:hypothetical protein
MLLMRPSAAERELWRWEDRWRRPLNLSRISRASRPLRMNAVTLRLPPQEAHCRTSSLEYSLQKTGSIQTTSALGHWRRPEREGVEAEFVISRAVRTAPPSRPVSQRWFADHLGPDAGARREDLELC